MIWKLFPWYFLFLLLGWLTFPLAYRLFRRLPDRAYALSRTLGLLLWGFFFWLLTSLGLLQNQPGGILVGLSILIGLSVWAGWGHWREIWDWVRAHRRLILMVELVFLLAFGFMALVRASNPEAIGTEKPMELAFINATLNSSSFPPKDPWLSGYAISYYHFGYILTAMLAKITSTTGGVAFNLMLVSVFALSAVGAYGVLYDLLSSSQEKDKHGGAQGWALLGPIFLLFIGNLESVLEILHQAGVGWDLAAGTSKLWQWINMESLLAPPTQPLGLVPQRYWWWWQASRVVQDIDLLGNVSVLSPIDEFPAFSFVLGDLHPHVLVMPFVTLVIGLAMNIFRGGMDGDIRVAGIRLPYKLDLFLLSVVLVGGIVFLNTWDLPVYFVLLVGAYLIRQVMQKGWGWERVGELLWLAVPLGLLALVLYLPFLTSFQSQAGGILPNIYYPTRGLYLWIMFGTLFIPIFLLFGRLWRGRVPGKWAWSGKAVCLLLLMLLLMSIGMGIVISRTDFGQQLIVQQGQSSILGLLGAALMHRLAYGFTLVTLALLLFIGLGFLLGQMNKADEPSRERGPLAFVMLMVVLGGVMVLAPEFVYLRDNFGTRMNTVFKFYYQAWMLWSLAAAYASALLLRKGSWVSRIVVALVIVMGLTYPALAYLDRTGNFKPAEAYSLDAGRYLRTYQPNEAAAIEWLAGAPGGTVAEAVGGQYSSYARVSTYSGQPAVLGWPGHEGQWRGGYTEVGTREQDIRTLYETADWQTALGIIRQYEIKYIYIGGLEATTYAVNPLKFEQHLQVGFEQANVRVFVVPEMLLAGP
jgi:YYY domain-containing protein